MSSKPITRKDIINDVITSCRVCHIAMSDGEGNPYVLPFNFGVSDGFIWFHSAMNGKKIDILKVNPKICVAFSGDYELGHRHSHVACSYFMKYKSVLVSGEIEVVDNYDKKIEGMNIIMKHYTGKDDFTYNKPAVDNVFVFRLKIENVTGRSYGY